MLKCGVLVKLKICKASKLTQDTGHIRPSKTVAEKVQLFICYIMNVLLLLLSEVT